MKKPITILAATLALSACSRVPAPSEPRETFEAWVTTDGNSTCVGPEVCHHLIASSDNFACGPHAGELLTTGNHNILIGPGAGRSLTSQSNVVIIGSWSGRGARDGATWRGRIDSTLMLDCLRSLFAARGDLQ